MHGHSRPMWVTGLRLIRQGGIVQQQQQQQQLMLAGSSGTACIQTHNSSTAGNSSSSAALTGVQKSPTVATTDSTKPPMYSFPSSAVVMAASDSHLPSTGRRGGNPQHPLGAG